MYHIAYSTAILLTFCVLSHARTVVISQNGENSYLPSSRESTVCMRSKCVIEASDILTSLDETVDPCDDFYRFACGGWMKRHEVTEDEPVVDVFNEVQNNLNRKLKELIESEYRSSDPPFVKVLKDVYKTCMDMDSIEKEGSEPLKRMLSRLGGWPVIEGKEWDESTFDWVDSQISFRKLGYDHNILLRLNVYPKDENDTTNIMHLAWPYGILPDDSNLTLGLDDVKIEAYLKTIIKAAKLLGADETTAENELQDVVKFMIALEESTKIKKEESEEAPTEEAPAEETPKEEKPQIYYTVKELQEEVPQIPWLKYFNGMINDVVYESDTVDVGKQIVFVKKLADLLTFTEKRVIANYMMLRAVLASTEYLSEDWKSIDKELKKLDEMSERKIPPRWKTCMSFLQDGMEIALSSYYVRHYFKDESKDEAMIMMKYIHKEFLKILKENDWMDEKTKKRAEEKANAMETYIGYPKELLNDTFVMKMYKNVSIPAESHLENNMEFRKIYVDEQLTNLRKSMDAKEASKFRFLLTVNAFYSPYGNNIGIPAGILHDAFYEKERPNYMNFGAIGYIIGHEITHGFDNSGRHFDKDGNRANWWDKESDEHYIKKVQCIIDQYDNYTIDDLGLKVNGELTQNENIADNGGLKEAYWAYQSWTKDNGIEPLLPALNYTQNQLFWLSAAHVWCSKMDAEKIKERLMWDSHSPDRYRIIGPMSNFEEFSKDFKCSADAPMNRKYKCKVW